MKFKVYLRQPLSVTTCLCLFVVCMLSQSVYAEEYNINPGMWETTSKMEVNGMPPEMAAMMQKPPKVRKECIKDKNYDFKPGSDAKGCSFQASQQSSKKLNWEITCGGEAGNASGKGEANFNGDSVSGWFEMNMPQGPSGPIQIRHKFEGKRIGSC